MTAPTLAELKVKLFTDGADKAQVVEMAKQPWIAGFTTNPSLLKNAGVSDYAGYARELVAAVPDRHISFEVFSEDVAEMVAQARVIAAWGKNVYVKLPVTSTRGEPLFEAVRTLSREGVKTNMMQFSPTNRSRALLKRSMVALPLVCRVSQADWLTTESITGQSYGGRHYKARAGANECPIMANAGTTPLLNYSESCL
jgi:transaldolase